MEPNLKMASLLCQIYGYFLLAKKKKILWICKSNLWIFSFTKKKKNYGYVHNYFSSIFRYGNQATADELNALYGDSRAKGFGYEVMTI